MHAPVAGSQVALAEHSWVGEQDLAVPPQTPEVHTSFSVHAFSSLQALPSDFSGLVQAPVNGLQTPATWQESLAVQVFTVPAHWPFELQVDTAVQAFPSSQALPI